MRGKYFQVGSHLGKMAKEAARGLFQSARSMLFIHEGDWIVDDEEAGKMPRLFNGRGLGAVSCQDCGRVGQPTFFFWQSPQPPTLRPYKDPCAPSFGDLRELANGKCSPVVHHGSCFQEFMVPTISVPCPP